MPPEVGSCSKLCTNQPYLSNNQKFMCGINSLDNLFLHSLGTLVLLETQFLRGVLSLLSFPSVLGNKNTED